MRWIASLVADAYRILVRGGVFLYPGDERQGLRHGPAAAGLRGQPDRLAGRAGRRRRHRHGRPHPRHRAATACTSACRWSSARPGKSSASPATTPTPARSPSARRCSAIAACSAPEGARHVRQASHHLDHRLLRRGHDLGQAHLRADLPPREDRGRLHRGRRLPPLRPRRHEGQGRRGGAQRQSRTSPISTPRPTSSRRCRSVFEEYGRKGTGRTRTYVHDDEEAKLLRRRRPAPSPPGATSRRATCSSTKGCTAAR